MHIIKAPKRIKNAKEYKSIFLAGSIEMGKAEDWQSRAANYIAKKSMPETKNLVLWNPRRDDFDISQEQNKNNPYFSKQVNWELDHLELCTYILMYFSPGTNSMISLMELGAHGDSGKIIVICPEGYCRKGNVDIYCERKNIPQFNTIENGIDYILNKIYG